MSTLEQVHAAEEAMKKAQSSLSAYVKQAVKGKDINLHLRLAAELKAATDRYFQLVLELK
jgi:hypothetical protein